MKTLNDGKKNNSQTDSAAELRDIKALLVLLLLKTGSSQTEVAGALGITQATVSRQFKFGQVKPLAVKSS